MLNSSDTTGVGQEREALVTEIAQKCPTTNDAVRRHKFNILIASVAVLLFVHAVGGFAQSGTVSEIASKSCYPATSCTTPSSPGVQAGDLVLAFVGGTNPAPTATWTNCSSTGSSTHYSSNGNNNNAIVSWCIASSTSPPVVTGGGGCASNGDCGIVLIQARSTTSFDTSTFLANGEALTFSSGAASGAPLQLTAANSFVVGYLLDESVLTSYSAVSGWTSGAGSTSHEDFTDYKLDAPSGSVSPVYGAGMASTSGQLGLSVAMGINAGSALSPPTFTPATPYSGPATNVSISATSGATILYCTDTANTCTPSTTYSGPIGVISGNPEYIRAKATESGYTDSSVASWQGTITGGGGTLSAPTFSPSTPYSGVATSVSISATSGATILYCTDTANTCTPSTTYSSSLSVSSSEYIRAQATESGYTSSTVSSWQGTITGGTLATPAFSPGTPYSGPSTNVSISGPTGATILYCTDTANACTPSTTYSSPIGISSGNPAYIRAKATESGYTDSSIASWQGTITGGGGTVSEIASKSCYPATSCTTPSSPGVQAGDLVLAFVGGTNPAPTAAWTNCSSTGSSTHYSSNGNNNNAIVSWCIASSTSPPVVTGGGGCASNGDCGIVLIQARSTTNFDTSTFLANGEALTFSSGAANGAPLQLTAANSFVMGYLLDESVLTSYSAGSGWTAGTGSTSHEDFTDYKLNVASGSVSPVYGAGMASTSGQLGLSVAMGINAGSALSPPTFTPATPYSGPATNVSISASSGAIILYCTDTANTCTPSTTYSGPISIISGNPEYVRAQATESGYISSSIASWQGTINTSAPPLVKLRADTDIQSLGLCGAFTDSAGTVIEPLAIGAQPWNFIVPSGATQLQLGITSDIYTGATGTGFVVLVNGAPYTVTPTSMPWAWTVNGQNFQFRNGAQDGSNPIVAATGLKAGDIVSVAYQSGTISGGNGTYPPVNADGYGVIGTAPGWSGRNYPTLYLTSSSYPQGQMVQFISSLTDSAGNPLSSVPVTFQVTGANPQSLQGVTDSLGRVTFAYAGANPGLDTVQVQVPAGNAVSNQVSITWTDMTNLRAPGVMGRSPAWAVVPFQSQQVFTFTATDYSGNPLPNLSVSTYFAHPPVGAVVPSTVITNSLGQASFTYEGTAVGDTVIKAYTTVNGALLFSWTAAVTVTQAAPALAFNPISTQVFGAAPFTVSAASPSNGAITYSVVSGPATSSGSNGSTITVTGVGTVTLLASQAATTDYDAATAQTSFTVTPATPTLTVKTSGSPSTFGQTVTFTATISSGPAGSISFYDGQNLLGSSPIASGTAIYTTSALSGGTHTITAVWGGDPDYATVTSSPVTQVVLSQYVPGVVYSYSITTPSGASGYAPNGNVQNYTDKVMGTWAFNYDTLNRIAGAQGTSTGSASPDYCWSYDAFGNRTDQESGTSPFTGGGAAPCSSQVNPVSYNANNQVSNGLVSYDQAGDVTADSNQYGAHGYLYDAEGRICAVESIVSGVHIMTGYIYDAEGRRVAKGTITTMSCDPNTNGFLTSGNETDYILDQDGHQVTEMASDGNGHMTWVHTNVWAAGQLIATYSSITNTNGQPDGTLHFYLNDWLGTRRAQTDYAGDLEQTCSSLPYGDGETCQPTPTEHLFTGKERDAESGNDYFGARYYASTMGRFLSPDWEGIAVPVPNAVLGNPQSLNLYSYGLNNPTTNVDDNGHDVNVCTTDSYGNQRCTLMSNEQYQAAQQGNNGGLNVPTLDQVGTNGSGNITDASGNVVGSATYVSNGGLDYYANQAGWNVLGTTGATMNDPRTIAGWYGASALAGGLVSLGIGEGGLATLGDLNLVPQIGSKLEYLLGHATGAAHSIQRSLTMAAELSSIGLVDSPETREYISQKIAESFSNPASFNAQTGMMETLLPGPGGFVKLETVWQGTQLITMFVKH